MIRRSRCQWREDDGLDDLWIFVLSLLWHLSYIHQSQELTVHFGRTIPLQVVETDYPAICNGQYNPIPTSSEPEIPYNIQGQATWVDDVIDIVKGVPYGIGRGVHYWELAWLNNTSLGSSCNDAILFTADYSAYPKMVG